MENLLGKKSMHGFPHFLHQNNLIFDLLLCELSEEPWSMQCTTEKHILSLCLCCYIIAFIPVLASSLLPFICSPKSISPQQVKYILPVKAE